jgi:signal transduction histidine kinase/CheY-like chemotaxis protein
MRTNRSSPPSGHWWQKYVTLALVWSVLVIGSLAWDIHQEEQSALRAATAAAIANTSKDISFRKWASSHGGVYVAPTGHTPPNPYLKVPERDVITTTGKSLTLMNPAYVLREMQTDFPGDYGFKSHITSLKLLNPDNAPDDWETKALQRFEHGEKEVLETQQIDGQPYLRLMRPFVVESSCLKCHEQQGYKVGDIRGGISASVPMKPYLADEQKLSSNMVLSHGTIWLLGLMGLGFMYRNERSQSEERQAAEEELRRYKDHLEEKVEHRTAALVLARNAAETANIAKSAFLASISHELRTPLNAILGFSNLMRQDSSLNQGQIQNLDIINRSGSHLLTLINDVLEMSRIEAGRVQLEESPFDLGIMVRDVIDMMEIRAREKGLRLLLDQSSQFPRYIVGDEARLRQILINLIGNAVKFTQQGGVTVRLSSRQNKISHLLIEVEDTGIGISAEDQKRLFQPFVQLGRQPADNQGTGLGLVITRQFVQLMGGSIALETMPGKGSIFQVELPLSEVQEGVILPPKDVVQGDVTGLADGQPRYRILIVEDQLENQMLLTQLMERIGFEVRVAEDGRQGVELFQNWQPHLIWMDRRMPVMDGIEATKVIRLLPGGKEVRIIAVTASAFTEQRSEMLAAGMDDFVRKPYHFNEIYHTLSRHLGVRYTYAETSEKEAIATPVVLTREMLAILPSELRNELLKALESLDSDRIYTVLQQVSPYDELLYKTLANLINNFDYPAILRVLQSGS